MLTRDRATEIVGFLDLDALPLCSACHLGVAFAIVDEAPPRVLAPKVTGACSWVWPEIETELLAQLRRAAMRGHTWANEALADLDARGARSWIVRGLVMQFATAMAEELRASRLERGRRPPPRKLPKTTRFR